MNDRVVIVLLTECQIRGSHNLGVDTLTLTRAPMTPRDVRRRYSKGRVLEVVFKKGYKNKGMCAGKGGQPSQIIIKWRRFTIQKQLPSLRVGGDALQKG